MKYQNEILIFEVNEESKSLIKLVLAFKSEYTIVVYDTIKL